MRMDRRTDGQTDRQTDRQTDGYGELLGEFLQKIKGAVVKVKYRLTIRHKTFVSIMHLV